MKNKKSQATMQCLMTILAGVVVITTLAYFGVFSIDSYISKPEFKITKEVCEIKEYCKYICEDGITIIPVDCSYDAVIRKGSYCEREITKKEVCEEVEVEEIKKCYDKVGDRVDCEEYLGKFGRVNIISKENITLDWLEYSKYCECIEGGKEHIGHYCINEDTIKETNENDDCWIEKVRNTCQYHEDKINVEDYIMKCYFGKEDCKKYKCREYQVEVIK